MALGAVALAVYFLVLETAAQTLAYDLFGLSALVVMLVGVRIHKPSRPLPWYLLMLGLLLWVSGDMIWSSFTLVLHKDAPFPSMADALYLLSYPALAAGLVLMIRGRTGSRDRSSLIDALTVTAAAGLLSWAFFIEPSFHDQTLSPIAFAVSMAYPLVDVLLLGVIVRLVFVPGARIPALRLLVLALPSRSCR
jgi:hypothetical protein